MLRILLADDHAVIRRALRCILETEAGWEICAEAKDGEEAVALAAEHTPDIVILDLVMPGLNGMEAARKIRSLRPEAQIAIVTAMMTESDELMRAAMAAGARAYLPKSEAEWHLVPAVRALARHEPYFLDLPTRTRLAS
jgi:DNA-binding NarL/FixJ family response regulator